MQVTLVIPARLQSTRLPQKLLQPIGDQPLLWHTVSQAKKTGIDKIIVATDSEEIATKAQQWGIEVCLTSPAHQSGTDRIGEVVERGQFASDDIIVNVQGDEPFIPPENILAVAENLSLYREADIATLCEPIHCLGDFLAPDRVKVVTDKNGFALYFSRAPIPWDRQSTPRQLDKQHPVFGHVGLYAYRVSFLKQFMAMPSCPLEQYEGLEQLRALYHGAKIHVGLAPQKNPGGVDTLEGLTRIRAYYQNLQEN